MTDTLTQRSAIESRIDGNTLVSGLAATAEGYADQPAYSDKVGVAAGDWRTLPWSDVREQALTLAAGLLDLRLQPGETVAIMASSRIEHVLADLAVVHAGGTPISVYSTFAPDQVAYVVEHASPAIVVLEGEEQFARWKTALTMGSIRAVVVIDESTSLPDDPRFLTWSALLKRGEIGDRAAVEARAKSVDPEQALTILYTSGTTGMPKGVVLTHHNVLFEAETSTASAGISGPGITVSYLPFAHIAERMLGMYIPQLQGGHVHLISNPALLAPTLAVVRPTRFFGVPRVWEKIQTGVSALLAAETDEAKKAGVAKAMQIGLQYVESQQTGHTTPPELEAAFSQMDGLVLAPMRALLGLDRVEWAASAAAPMPLETARWFAGLGIRIYDVYGMTETCASVTAGTPSSFRLGTVGRPLLGVEVTLAHDGEILARGPLVTPGYLKNPTATAELVDADGWVHTGDIGELDADGFLKVIDRKKELIITSSGKNIAPSNVENYLKESPLVGHALAYGEGKPYVVALLTLDPDLAPVIATKLGLEYDVLADLARHPAILAAVGQAVDQANERLARPEQVKKWELLPVEWTAESAELTPTLKLKRRVVHTNYADVIDRLYA